MKNLNKENLKVDQLKEYSKNLGLSNYSNSNKNKLIVKINSFLNSSKGKWDILQHQTFSWKLEEIFKAEELKPKDSTFEKYSNFLKTGEIGSSYYMHPSVYLHYMFSDLIYNGLKWNYNACNYDDIVICIDTKIFEGNTLERIFCRMEYASCVTLLIIFIFIKMILNFYKILNCKTCQLLRKLNKASSVLVTGELMSKIDHC